MGSTGVFLTMDFSHEIKHLKYGVSLCSYLMAMGPNFDPIWSKSLYYKVLKRSPPISAYRRFNCGLMD